MGRKYDRPDWQQRGDFPPCVCGYHWPKKVLVEWVVAPLGKPLETFLRCPQCKVGGLLLSIQVVSAHPYSPEDPAPLSFL